MESILANLVSEDFGFTSSGKWGRSVVHDSLVVNLERDIFFWNSENKFGNAIDYLIKVRGLSKRDALKLIVNTTKKIIIKTEDVQNYSPYEELVNILWENGKSNREYWYTRTLTDETIDKFKLGFYQDWFTIPIYRDEHFINFQCRRDNPEKRIINWYKGSHPSLINSEILKFVNKVYLVEGAVDPIVLSQNGIPAVSHNSGNMGFQNEWFKYFCNQKEIIYIADNDKAGIEGAIKVTKILGEDRTKVFRFKDKKQGYDSGDWFKDGGDGKVFMDIVNSGAVMGYCTGDF